MNPRHGTGHLIYYISENRLVDLQANYSLKSFSVFVNADIDCATGLHVLMFLSPWQEQLSDMLYQDCIGAK